MNNFLLFQVLLPKGAISSLNCLVARHINKASHHLAINQLHLPSLHYLCKPKRLFLKHSLCLMHSYLFCQFIFKQGKIFKFAHTLLPHPCLNKKTLKRPAKLIYLSS